MTYWRKASSLLLIVRHNALSKSVTNNSDKQHEIMNESRPPVCGEDYKLLMLKRSATSSFFPSSLVFPGGTISSFDSSSDWKCMFEMVTGTAMKEITEHFCIPDGVRPPIISDSHDELFEVISADIAFRICAIREAFEECGILLVKGRRSNVNPWYNVDFDVEMWQQRVSENAAEFLTLCRRLSVVPNIWALHEWSNWLTPAMKKVKGPPAKPRRFDTLFYICCAECEDLPKVNVDKKEIVDHQWLSPTDYRRNIKSISPQSYEMGRLSKFHNMNQLREFAEKRQKFGIERLMSVMVKCRDAVIFVLPGDELYPRNPDYYGTHADDEFFDVSYTELCDETRLMHRHVRTEDGKTMMLCNCHTFCGHVIPDSYQNYSKL